MIAEFIAHYRIIEKLGAGGMGEVYLAQDTKLDRKVAIKVLPADSVADETAKKRLIREAQAAAKLDHPNICAIYEVNEADAVTFIVMQYIEGETLAEKLKKKKLKLSTALDVARQTAEALAEAHANGIVHRDIKPQNIMITRRDQVKILDFGLSKKLQTNDDVDNEAPTKSLLSTPGNILGTIPYMSPEQLSGDALDASSDIFSLGVTFYEMMSGKHPFKGKTNTVTMSQILLAEPVPSERLKTRTSPELQRLLAKMLSKKKEERYQSATELLADLKQLPAPVLVTFDETQSIAVPLPSSTKELSAVVADDSGAGLLSKVARYKWALIGLLAVAVAAVGIRAYFLSPKVDSLAILPFTYSSSDSALMANRDYEYLSEGFTDSVISSLAQLKDLKVIARSSVFHYQGKELGPQAIGRELKVRAVLVGHIQQEGDELTIKAELLNVEDNSQLWLGNYSKRKLADSQAIQQDIAKNIAATLRVKFSGADQTRPKTYTENSEAYQAYLKGRYHWNKRSDEGFKQAIKFFEEAKDKDPKYALAYSGLADCYTLRSDYGFMSPTDGYALAKTWAGIALQYDESLAEAHTSLASIIAVKDWDWQGAEREYLKAIELNPNYATAHHWYATQLLIQGKFDQALVEIKKAQQLDPLSLGINKDLAVIHLYMGNNEKALEQCRETLRIDDLPVMSTYIAQVHEAKKNFTEAISELEKARALDPDDREINYGLAQAYALSGRWDEARKLADQLSQSTKENMDLPKEAAFLYLSLGEKDKAVSILQKAYENHHISVAEVKTDPRFKSLQTDPRVVEILRNIGLSQ